MTTAMKPSSAAGAVDSFMTLKTESGLEVSLPTIIAYLRRKQGYSARQLSDKAHLSPSYVQKVESGEMKMSLSAFCRIVTILGLNKDEIIFLVRREGSLEE